MNILQLQHLDARYYDEGDGPPVMLVHCSSSSHKEWSFVADRLAQRHRVIAPDLLGYGGSAPWPAGDQPVADTDLDLVQALIEAAGAPVHLIAHSYGAAVCLEAAKDDATRGTNRVASLLLVEPVSFHLLNDGANGAEWQAIAKVGRKCIDAVAAGRNTKAANAYMDFWLGPVKWRLAPKRFRHEVIRTIPKVAYEFGMMFERHDRADDYDAIACPVTLVRGGKSPRPAIRVVELLHAALSQAELATVDGAGHMSPFTHRQEIGRLVERHLDRVGAAVMA